MLELKTHLFNLRDSPDLEHSLEILISKVNDNISHLKGYHSQPNEDLSASDILLEKQ